MTLTRKQALQSIQDTSNIHELIKVMGEVLGTQRLSWGDDEAYIRGAAWAWFNTSIIVGAPSISQLDLKDGQSLTLSGGELIESSFEAAKKFAGVVLQPLIDQENWTYFLKECNIAFYGEPIHQIEEKQEIFGGNTDFILQNILKQGGKFEIMGVKKIIPTVTDIDKLFLNPPTTHFSQDLNKICEKLGLSYIAYHPRHSLEHFEKQLSEIEKATKVMFKKLNMERSMYGLYDRFLSPIIPKFINSEESYYIGAFSPNKILKPLGQLTENEKHYYFPHHNSALMISDKSKNRPHPFMGFNFDSLSLSKKDSHRNVLRTVAHEWTHSFENWVEISNSPSSKKSLERLYHQLKKIPSDSSLQDIYLKNYKINFENEKLWWNDSIWHMDEKRKTPLFLAWQKNHTLEDFEIKIQNLLDGSYNKNDQLKNPNPLLNWVESMMIKPNLEVLKEASDDLMRTFKQIKEVQKHFKKGHSVFLTHACLSTPSKKWVVGRGSYHDVDYFIQPKELLARIGEKYFSEDTIPPSQNLDFSIPQGEEWQFLKGFFHDYMQDACRDWTQHLESKKELHWVEDKKKILKIS